MTAVKTPKSPKDVVPLHPVMAEPIPHAYALVPDPNQPGRFWAVHLIDVVPRAFEHIEFSGRSDIAARGLLRIEHEMEERHRRKKWGRGT